MRDSRNDLGTLIGGQKGIKVNVLPTDQPTDGRTDTVTYSRCTRLKMEEPQLEKNHHFVCSCLERSFSFNVISKKIS